MRTIFALAVLLFATTFGNRLSASVEAELKSISYEDRFFLNNFFYDFFFYNLLGHVLFYNTKPACLWIFSIEPHQQHFLEKLEARGWIVWKKYEHLFPHPRFIFVEEEIELNKRKYIQVMVINKQSLAVCLKKHCAVFNSVLGEHFSVETFITQVEKEKKISSLIREDEHLLGIILGYGEESAAAFKEKNGQGLCLADVAPYHRIDIQKPQRCVIIPVGFVGNPHSQEVQGLARAYESELAALWTKYKCSRNTLRLVLEQLCSPEPSI